MERAHDRAPHGLGDRFQLAGDVDRGDLLSQVAYEVLLARHAHEVRVPVAVAHVAERVLVAELLVPGLEVDFGVVFGADPVDVVVAVIDVDIHAAQRIDDVDEAREVDVDDSVEL